PPWDGSAVPISVQGDVDAPTTRAAAAAMSSTFEQRVVTAVFAGFPPIGTDESVHAFAAIAEAHGAACHPTLGHRIIAVFGGARTTGDEVMRAARAALEAAERVPHIQLAIATGRALAGLTGLSGELVERGARAVDAPGERRIYLDDATARLLAEHFVVEGRVLTGAR